MKRFNLIEQVKGLINGYSDEVGTRYFILSMVNEFNPRCDDSWFQALFLEYNPTLYNGNEEYIDTLSNAGRYANYGYASLSDYKALGKID